MKLNILIGSGRKIALFVLPFLIVGTYLNIKYPSFFTMGLGSDIIKYSSIIIILAGLINWIWSVVLIATKVPRKELITSGPFAVVKHPLYTGMAILILPWLGILLNTWLGIGFGLVFYLASRIFSPEEEKFLSAMFGSKWDEYNRKVIFPWI